MVTLNGSWEVHTSEKQDKLFTTKRIRPRGQLYSLFSTEGKQLFHFLHHHSLLSKYPEEIPLE